MGYRTHFERKREYSYRVDDISGAGDFYWNPLPKVLDSASGSSDGIFYYFH
ncbi:hypothetical protein [Sphingobacterium gobiense]|uniref:hypothetical protein n=1 Tax=Sphingobacterium gobiense TaxID=1382456 RepID=UPI0015E34981|nr:hypothetical protein [Sphingobacterium gobiense]